MSGLNQYSGATGEVASLGLAFLNLDGSGNLMKLSQMLKTYSRFRFLDINHGAYLSNYFESSASRFDPPSSKPRNTVTLKNRKYYRNMLKYNIALDPLETNSLRIGIFAGSWIFKLIGIFLLRFSLRKNSIGKFRGIAIALLQKFHMIAVNLAALDIIPYSQRALF